MRLRRSLFFVAPATPAGSPLAATPARPSRPSLADPAGEAAVCPAPPSCPRLPRPRRVCPVAKNGPPLPGSPVAANQVHESRLSQPQALRRKPQPPARRPTRHESRITAFMAVRLAVGAQGSHNQKPPPSQCFPAHFCPELPGISRNFPAPFYCLPAHDCAALWGIVRNCAVWGAVLLPLSKCPRTVRRSRWASRRAPFAAAPVALQAASAAANAKGTHAEKGEPSILHKQGIFLYCVDSRTSRFDPSHPIRYSQKTNGTQALAGIGRFRSSRQLLGVAA